MARKSPIVERVTAWSLVVILLMFWETGARLNLWRPNLMPAPTSILQSLSYGFADGSLPIAIRISLTRMIVAFVAALGLPANRKTVAQISLEVEEFFKLPPAAKASLPVQDEEMEEPSAD